MDLALFSVQNYKRFSDQSSVKTAGKLVAFVGPNEAGKSSILQALQHVNSDLPFDRREHPRRTKKTPFLQWTFDLTKTDYPKDEDDLKYENSTFKRLVVTKDFNGRSFSLRPFSADVGVDIDELRRRVAEEFGELEDTETATKYRDSIPDLFGFLASKTPESETEIDKIQIALDELTADEGLSQIRTIRRLLSALQRKLDETNTRVRFANFLKGKIPEFILFGSADRDLKSEYDLQECVTETPKALDHLRALANLDLAELLEEVSNGHHADARTRIRHANKKLEGRFTERWKQQGVCLQIDLDDSNIRIFATAPADGGLTDIVERSDGMRWFAMLLAFIHGWPETPVLLADEIETHLHYDAQSDIINALGSQNSFGKILYTTHSFACLPNDLGRSVNVVRMTSDLNSSLETGIWKGGAGFTPLMAAMGAAAASFAPSRRVLMGEGPTEAVLLPSLLRSVDGVQLDFQVAPGLANIASSLMPQLANEAPQVAYIVDGDEGGLAIKEKLIANGVAGNKIVELKGLKGEAMEIEDLVDWPIYITAVRSELEAWNDIVPEIEMEKVSTLRTKSVRKWCEANSLKEPDKVGVAYRVLSAASDSQLVADSMKPFVENLIQQINEALNRR